MFSFFRTANALHAEKRLVDSKTSIATAAVVRTLRKKGKLDYQLLLIECFDPWNTRSIRGFTCAVLGRLEMGIVIPKPCSYV